MTKNRVTLSSAPIDGSFVLSSRNTGLALQRTRMAADRTLMAVIRTSLSLISFGFTISQLFQRLAEICTWKIGFTEAPKFGLALVVLGIMMLVVGITYHVHFMRAMRAGRRRMVEDGLVHGESPFPPSLTLITALFLLGIGIAAVVSMVYHVGPFE